MGKVLWETEDGVDMCNQTTRSTARDSRYTPLGGAQSSTRADGVAASFAFAAACGASQSALGSVVLGFRNDFVHVCNCIAREGVE